MGNFLGTSWRIFIFQLFINMNSTRRAGCYCCSWKRDPMFHCRCYPTDYTHCNCCYSFTFPWHDFQMCKENADVCWSPIDHDKMGPRSEVISAKLQSALLGNRNSGAVRRPIILDAFSLLGKNFFTYESCKPPRWWRNTPCTCANSIRDQASSSEEEESPRKRRKVEDSQ